MEYFFNFGVRKYDDEVGRFTSIDPLFEKYYNWSPYQYSFNNPIRNLDRDGKKVEVYSSPINVPPVLDAKHLFIVIRDDKSKEVTATRSLKPNYHGVIAGIKTLFSLPMESHIYKNVKDEMGEVKKKDSDPKSSNVKLEVEIKVPDGMKSEDFDKKVLKEADKFDVNSFNYKGYGPNSNTFVDDVIE